MVTVTSLPDILYKAQLYHANRAADTDATDWIGNEADEDSFATCNEQAHRQQEGKHQAQRRGHGVARDYP